jgi:hypothetical protein
VETQQQALVGAAMKPAKKWAVVLVDMGAGVNITADEDEGEDLRSDAARIRSGRT